MCWRRNAVGYKSVSKVKPVFEAFLLVFIAIESVFCGRDVVGNSWVIGRIAWDFLQTVP